MFDDQQRDAGSGQPPQPGAPPEGAPIADPREFQNSLPQNSRSPYEPPSISSSKKTSPTPSSKDQSVFSEPWLQQGFFPANSDDLVDIVNLQRPANREDLAENSVWDEPSTSVDLVGEVDPTAVTWFRFYLQQAAQTPRQWSWLVTLAIVVMAGPLAILGTLITATGYNAWLMMVVMGPTIEEILKIALPLWVVEKRPWLFSSSLQIFLCCAGAGLVFAAIENFVYLFIYFPDPSSLLILWRWTVCVALHTGCSMVASLGLMTVYQNMLQRGTRPQLKDGSHWIVAAIVIHGGYNFLAILFNDWFQ